MQIKADKKTMLWIAGAAVLAAHFGPGIYNAIHPVHAGWRKPSPAVPMVRPSVPPPVPLQPADPNAPLKQLSGVWIGETVMQDRGSCKLRLELGVKPLELNAFTGDSTLSCAPNLGMMRGTPVGNHQLMSALNARPVSGIFSGQAQEGSIDLKLDQLVGDAPNGCHPTAFSITPFGQNNIAAKWQQNKTVQGILRHSRIQTTLDLYTQQDSEEARAAQGEYLMALRPRAKMVQ
jgi:hypothetical protein